MEAAHKPASAHELSLSSNFQQAPLTVNPKYPLPSPLLPPQAPGRTSLPDAVEGNGISRISSRRRRVSGKSQMDSISHATMVESPKLPPLSYRDPYGNGTSDGPTTRNSSSFAERVRAAPSGLISAHTPNDDFDPMIQRTASNRRGSLNRPPGTLYAAVQSSSRASYPSTNIGTTVPLVSPNDPIPTQVQAPDTQAPQNTSRGSTQIPRYQEDSVHATSRPTSRRISAGVADRSPLQDLEVKLNDISKGGKRARVEEAEQLLKESRSGARGPTSGQDVDSIVNTKQVGRSSADQGGKLRSRLADESRQGHVEVIERRGQDNSTNTRSKPEKQSAQSLLQSEIQQSPLRRNPNPQSDLVKVPAPSKLPLSYERNRKSLTRAVQASEYEQDPGRAPIEDPSTITELDQDIEFTVGKPNRIIKLVKPGFPLPLENVPALARLERPSGDQVAMGTNLSKQTSRQQKPSSRENTDKPKSNNSLPSDQATLNPAKLLSKNRNRDASTYLKLPHPSDGTAAGKQSGSSHSPLEVSEGTAHDKYHLGNFLQHSHHHDPNFQGEPAAKPSRLDEWRRAETARLTAADLNPGNETAKKQSAWWESIGSNVYHSANAKVRNKRDVQSLDGGYDELYGKTSLSPSRQNRSMEFLPQISYSINAAHARRYIANDEVDQGREESWLRGYAHLHAKEKHIGLSTAYSHSCPHLDEHDGSHPYHICKPYMSKQLIKSMRAIRIRAAPPTASFNPPLYLKCGPLLRYTGLDRQVPANGAADSSSKNGLERELWRGSVMIVTVDADSSYNPPPVLRLFPEPIDLLPPPPEPVDDGSGQSLPSEYIDPIAGLPKLSRTGKTVYVKPVEDLEEQVDLSRVEDDGGLFEETRTAAVPTSYGQPSSRPRGDLSSQPISTSGGRRERDNSIRYQKAKGVKLHAERGVTFWRFSLEIELTERQVRIAYRINNGASVGFWIPARGQTMNVMFHTCNGFSMSIKSVLCINEPASSLMIMIAQINSLALILCGGMYSTVIKFAHFMS